MQQSAYGFRLTVDSGLDLSSATTIRFKLKRPSGSVVTRLLGASEVTDANAGLLSIEIESGNLSESGYYHIQIIDETIGRYMPSSVGKFLVNGGNI